MTTYLLHDLRARFIAFYKERQHTVIPSAPLRPDNDATTLFIGSGMQPLVPYLMGQKHPAGTRLVNSQRCFRAEDIEEVGDNRHTTFFEMLGNWSLGDYFKEEQIPWVWQFLVDDVGLDPHRLYVTCFAGSEANGVVRDDTAAEIWQKLFAAQGITAQTAVMGSEADGSARGMREGERIFFYDASKNWWSRAGAPAAMPVGEIGGPDSEIFYDFGTPHDPAYGPHCHPNCDCGRFMEIGNSVFMAYRKEEDGTLAPLPHKNVDFGGGLERIAAAASGNADIFALDIFAPLIRAIERESGARYDDATQTEAFRVIVDHLRGSVFMITDGIAAPSNKEAGYVLRRLLRRSVLYADRVGVPAGRLAALAEHIVDAYAEVFDDVRAVHTTIVATIEAEEEKFRRALRKGLREFDKIVAHAEGVISGQDAFVLFTTYGFPLELTQEMAQERGLRVDTEGFDAAFAQHQKQSQTAATQKFKGGLADHSAVTTAYHTATHLMLAALRNELGNHVHQAGSNITAERTRFDFTHPEKVSREVLDRVETAVNVAIDAGASVRIQEMGKEQARRDGVEGSFWEKYPERVTVYTVEGPDGAVYSRELCGGPHVTNTAEIAQFGRFVITKEQSSGAGIRRIKAVFVKDK